MCFLRDCGAWTPRHSSPQLGRYQASWGARPPPPPWCQGRLSREPRHILQPGSKKAECPLPLLEQCQRKPAKRKWENSQFYEKFFQPRNLWLYKLLIKCEKVNIFQTFQNSKCTLSSSPLVWMSPVRTWIYTAANKTKQHRGQEIMK